MNTYFKKGDNFECFTCDRVQSYAPVDQPGGITEDEAQSVGWVRKFSLLGKVYWLCPICSGQEHLLRKVFKGGPPIKGVS